MAGRCYEQIERAGAILGRWFRQRHRDPRLQQYTLQSRWPELVGERLAQRTEPLSLRDRLLTVAVDSSAWLNELSLMRGQIVTRINELIGAEIVAAIRLVAGRVHKVAPRQPIEEQPAYVELPPEEVERVEAELAGVGDPELRVAMKQARLAQLKRMLRGKG